MKNKILFFPLIILMILGVSACSSDEFSIDGTCWDVDSDTLYCFNKDNIYYVKNSDNGYRTTKNSFDMFKLTKTDKIEGNVVQKLAYSGTDVYYSYLVRENDGKKTLFWVYYDYSISASASADYPLSSVTFSDVNIVNGNVTFNIFGNDYDIMISNYNRIPLSIFQNEKLNIKDENGTSLTDQGYIFQISYNSKDLLFLKKTDYENRLRNTPSSNWDFSAEKLCYKVDNGNVTDDVLTPIDINAKKIYVDYCNNMK